MAHPSSTVAESQNLYPHTNPAVKFTYQDYLLTPEDRRYELIEGDLLMTAPPNVKHQSELLNLSLILGNHVHKHRLGTILFAPVAVYLSETNVLEPDLIYVSKEREIIIQEQRIKGPPDLVVEILSPSTKSRDRVIKRHLYAKFRVREYWIVDPDAETIEQLVLSGKDYKTTAIYQDKDKVLPRCLKDLTFPARKVFE